jgi:hypothetical protein
MPRLPRLRSDAVEEMDDAAEDAGRWPLFAAAAFDVGDFGSLAFATEDFRELAELDVLDAAGFVPVFVAVVGFTLVLVAAVVLAPTFVVVVAVVFVPARPAAVFVPGLLAARLVAAVGTVVSKPMPAPASRDIPKMLSRSVRLFNVALSASLSISLSTADSSSIEVL